MAGDGGLAAVTRCRDPQARPHPATAPSSFRSTSPQPYVLCGHHSYSMSGKPTDDTTGQVRPEGDVSDVKVESANQNKGAQMPSPQQEEAAIKKKYGGVLPKKTPLISKDHERAYFDSADWALGKQGGHPQKPKGPLEALRPKLQPTQQQARSRRFLHASADNEEGASSPMEETSQNQDSTEGQDKDKK